MPLKNQPGASPPPTGPEVANPPKAMAVSTTARFTGGAGLGEGPGLYPNRPLQQQSTHSSASTWFRGQKRNAGQGENCRSGPRHPSLGPLELVCVGLTHKQIKKKRKRVDQLAQDPDGGKGQPDGRQRSGLEGQGVGGGVPGGRLVREEKWGSLSHIPPPPHPYL